MRTFHKADCGVDNVDPACVFDTPQNQDSSLQFFWLLACLVLKTQQMKINLIRTSFDALTVMCFALMICVQQDK